jgi:hypothetical protein
MSEVINLAEHKASLERRGISVSDMIKIYWEKMGNRTKEGNYNSNEALQRYRKQANKRVLASYRIKT